MPARTRAGGSAAWRASALAICVITTVLCGYEVARAAGAATENADDRQPSLSDVGNAGLPNTPRRDGTGAPTAADLDQRDRMLTAPRPSAGPPLGAVAPTTPSGGKLPAEVTPPATDPAR